MLAQLVVQLAQAGKDQTPALHLLLFDNLQLAKCEILSESVSPEPVPSGASLRQIPENRPRSDRSVRSGHPRTVCCVIAVFYRHL